VLRPAVHGRSDVLRVFTLQHLGDAAGVFDNFHAANELAHRVIEHLAVLVGDGGDNLVSIFFQQLFETEHDTRALDRRRVPPGREGSLCRGNCLFHGLLRRHGNVPRDLTRGGVRNGLGPVRIGNVLAVDEVTDDVRRVDVVCGAGAHKASCRFRSVDGVDYATHAIERFVPVVEF
jgi:hypothetical protein